MKFEKNQLSWRHLAQAGERNWGGGVLTTIDTYPDTKVPHAPPHMEENMPENHSRRRLSIFGRWSRPHASSETHVSAETNGA